MHVRVRMHSLMEARSARQIRGAGFTGSCEQPRGCLEMYLRPLEAQQWLLATGLSRQLLPSFPCPNFPF